jgi:hypothetical protein
MNGPVKLVMACAIVVCAAAGVSAQSTIQPASPPLVTADTEQWYQSGEPLLYAGNYYYPAGAQVHFNGNEMVRTGSYRGVPLYARTTIEPFSIVFVPARGGVMQPYERRRAGEIAGLSGSSAPSFPVASTPGTTSSEVGAGIVAAIPLELIPTVPMATSTVEFEATAGRMLDSSASPVATVPQSVGMSGRATPTPPAPRRVATAPAARPALPRADAANGVFVEFDNARWFSSGPTVEFDARTFTRIGELNGVPVYQARDRKSTIFIPVARGLDVVAPYSKRNN